MPRTGLSRKSFAIVSFLVVTLGLLLVVVVPKMASASTDLYGFDLSTPSEFNEGDGKNPYGKGYFSLNTKSEALVWYQGDGSMNASVYNYNGQPSGSAIISASNKINAIASGGSSYKFISTVGYDPNGTGHADSVAAVGLDDSDDDEQKLVVMRYNGTGGQVRSRKLNFMRNDDDDDSDWQDEIEQWAYNAYFVITAGDYDGNGTDELAVYFMQRGNPRVLVLNGQTLDTIRELPLVNLIGSTGAYLSNEFSKDSWTARATPQLSMDSSDIDRDGCDDLVVVASYADIYDDSDGEELKERSSVLGYYPKASSLSQRWVLNKGATSHYMRTAAVSAGDIDNDGFDEVVVAGFFMDEDGPDADDDLNGSQYLITTLDYATSAGSAGLSLGVSRTVDMNKFTKSGYYGSDTMVGTPALTCFKARGRNAAEYIFLAGTVYKWEDNSWKVDNTASHCTESDRGIDGWLITNTWVDHCVAANFDSNELGAEQVMFSSGYKQDSVSRFFYRVDLVGYGTKTEGEKLLSSDFYECQNTQVVDRSTKGNRPCCTFAALDVDNDTDVYRYKSKRYEYSNVNVMAILQAPPYFDDIKNDYFAAVGTTCYGRTDGTEHSTKVTASARAGCYISAEVETPVLNVTTESTFTHEWLWEYEDALSQEFSWTLENHAYDNGVALYRTPVTLYDYEVTLAGSGEKKSMTIGIPEEPTYVIIDAERYNELVSQDPTMSGKEVTTAVAGCIAGIPESYPSSAFGLKNFTGARNKITVSNRNSTQDFATQVITTGESSSASQSYTESLNLKVGVSVGMDLAVGSAKIGGGVEGGASWGSGQTTVDYSSVEKTGQVAFPPATETEFAFNFRFGTWSTKLGDTEVPVLGYVIDSVTSPPSRPKDLAVETVSKDSITIGWKHGVKPPQLYEVYQYFEDDISGVPYSLLKTIDGSSIDFTYDGLLPNTTYHLSIRSVSYVDGERRVSPYTAVVSATTLSDAEAPIITGITKEQNVRVDDTAVFVVTARPSPNATSGLTYAWQVRQAGSTSWAHCGAKSDPTLTLDHVTQNMDGNRYRCVVSQTIGGKRTYAYSDVGVLNVGLADSRVDVTATNVDQRQNNPYLGTNRGLAGVVRMEDDPNNATTVPTDKQLVITVGQESEPRVFVAYHNAHENKSPEYVYFSSGTYYALEGLDEEALTAQAMVPLSLTSDHFEVEDASSLWNTVAPGDLLRTGPQATYAVGESTYLQYQLGDKLLLALVDDQTTSWYELDENYELKAYEGETSGAEPIFVEADQTVSVLDGAIVAEGTEGATSYDAYWPRDHKTSDLVAYRSSDGVGPWYVADASGSLAKLEVCESDGLYRGQGQDGSYVASIGDVVQVDASIIPQKAVTYTGDKVSLFAQVSTSSISATLEGTVTFVLNNTTTGEVRTVATTANAEGQATLEWFPEQPGVYEVTAGFGGNSSLRFSTSKTTYYALDHDQPEDSVYVLEAQDVVYGDTIELQMARMMPNDEGGLVKEELPAGTSVRYTVAYTNLDGEETIEDLGANHSYTPGLAGNYTFVAKVSGDQSGGARLVVHVSRRPIVFKAPSRMGLSSQTDNNKVPTVDDVVVEYRGDATKDAIIDRDKTTYTLNALLTLTSTPELTADAGEGVYVTSLGYRVQDESADNVSYVPEVTEFIQKYDAELQNGQYVVEAGVYTVTFAAGSNGKLQGYQGNDMRAIASGDSLTDGTMLNFVATPNERFKVASWSVQDAGGADVDYKTMGDGDQICISSLKTNLNVRVTFDVSSHQLTFSSSDHGTIRGNYVTDDQVGAEFFSPEEVATGKGFVLTATPDEGYVIERWTIARGGAAPQEYADEYGAYSGDTLTIGHMDDNMSIQVYFVEECYHYVSTLAVDETGNNAAGCQVLVEGVREDGSARHGSRVTFTADIPDQMVVKEWRLYLTDTDYVVLQGSSASYVVGSLQYDMRIGIEVAQFKQLKVHYGVVADDGAQLENVVTATSKGVAIQDGDACAAYIPIDFAASIPKGYQVGSWSVRKGDGEEEVVVSGKDQLSYALTSLVDETWVTLCLEHQPTLTYEVDGGHGTIECTDANRTSGDAYDKYRVDDFTFVATPDEGYELNALLVEPAEGYAEVVESQGQSSDTRRFTLKAPSGGFVQDMVITASFRELPHIDVAFELYNDGSGTHGTIGASADRKGDERYVREASASSSGADLRTVYRDSVVTIATSADVGYGIQSWKVGGIELMGDAGLSYAHVGDTDNVLVLTITDELLATLEDATTIEVLAQNGLRGGAVTFGTKGNTGGSVVARHANGDTLEYGTIMGVPETLTFQALPKEGCVLVDWEVNGVSVGQTGSMLDVDVDGIQAYDVRAVIAVPQPVETHTLTFAAVGDELGAHGSVSAYVSKLPNEPAAGSYNSSNHKLNESLASGCVVDHTTGVRFAARAEQGYAVQGWYADKECETELFGSAEELQSYLIDSVEDDVQLYVKFAPVPTFSIEVVQDGTGEGSYGIFVDGKELGPTDLSPTAAGVSFKVRRHSTVEVVARPSGELNKVTAWNGVASEDKSYVVQDVTSNHLITLTLSPSQIVEVLFKTNEDCESASVWLLSPAGEDAAQVEAVNTTVRLPAGKTVRFDVVPVAGKMVDSWKVTYANGSVTTGDVLGIDNSITLSDLMLSATVEVSMREITTHAVPYAGMGEGTGSRVDDVVVFPDTLGDAYPNRVRDGGYVTFTVSPEQNYVVDGILDANTDVKNGANVLTAQRRDDGSYVVTITNVKKDVDLRVDAKRLYTVNILGATYGHVVVEDADGTPIASGSKVRENTELTVRAVPNSNCVFEGWGDPLQDNKMPVVSHTLVSDVTFSASFYRTFKVTIAQSKKGSVTVRTADGDLVSSGQRLREGTKLELSAKAAKYCVFERWNKPNKLTSPQTTATLDGDLVVEARFYRTYKVKVGSSKYGKIRVVDSASNVIKSGQRVREGTVLRVKAIAKSKCEFVRWGKPLKGKPASTKFKLAADTTFNARFCRTWRVTIGKGKLGSIAVTTKDGTKVKSGQRVREGTVLKIQAMPATNCEFSWWTSTLKGRGVKTSWKVTSNVTFAAKFVRKPLVADIANVSGNSIQIRWSEVVGADRYVVYFNWCDGKKLTKIFGYFDSSVQSTEFTGLEAGRTYKFMVVAQKKSGKKYKKIVSSLDYHLVTTGSYTLTNPKTVKVAKKTEKLGVGMCATTLVRVTKEDTGKSLLGHTAPVRYVSSNTNVATVSSEGEIFAKRAGTCTVYAQAENGTRVTIKVVVS